MKDQHSGEEKPYFVGTDKQNDLILYDSKNVAPKQGFIIKETAEGQTIPQNQSEDYVPEEFQSQFYYQSLSQNGTWLQVRECEPILLNSRLCALMFHNEDNQLVFTKIAYSLSNPNKQKESGKGTGKGN